MFKILRSNKSRSGAQLLAAAMLW